MNRNRWDLNQILTSMSHNYRFGHRKLNHLFRGHKIKCILRPMQMIEKPCNICIVGIQCFGFWQIYPFPKSRFHSLFRLRQTPPVSPHVSRDISSRPPRDTCTQSVLPTESGRSSRKSPGTYFHSLLFNPIVKIQRF